MFCSRLKRRVWFLAGIPQLGNLSHHLVQVATDLETAIPDVAFAGVGVIDFESWRPLFRWNWDSLSGRRPISPALLPPHSRKVARCDEVANGYKSPC